MSGPVLTSGRLIATLRDTGRDISGRLLTSWRKKDLLPELSERGRGQARGKVYYWRYPKIVDQAASVHDLLAANQPAELARLTIWFIGYRVAVPAVRRAWNATLESVEQNLAAKRRVAIRRQGHEFYDREDEFSALARPLLRMLSRQFSISLEKAAQPVIDALGLSFDPDFVLDEGAVEGFALLAVQLLSKIGFAATGMLASERDLQRTLEFLQSYMSLPAAQEAMKAATDMQLRHAHRQWRAISRMALYLLPELTFDARRGRLANGQVFAADCGRQCIPALVRFMLQGDKIKVDKSIDEIKKFIFRFNPIDFISIMMPETLKPEFKAELNQLLAKLESIWNWHGFPFRASGE